MTSEEDAVREDIKRRALPPGVAFCFRVSSSSARSTSIAVGATSYMFCVIPGRAQREPGIQ